MNLNFDSKGHLIPYERIKITLLEFEEFFIKSKDQNSKRIEIFDNYKNFIQDFSEEVSSNFTHWIDGSFVTNKTSPRDIDFVTLIDHEIYKLKRELIDSKFRLRESKIKYGVDAYTLEVLPQDHERYGVFEIDLIYWDSWFSKTKKNWQKKSFPKGYIEINFGN